MSVKQELVAAGKEALLRDGLDAMGAMGARALAIRVIEAVEPLIQIPAWRDGYNTAKAAADAVFTEDRDKIESLRAEAQAIADDPEYAHVQQGWLSQVAAYTNVLDLLDGID